MTLQEFSLEIQLPFEVVSCLSHALYVLYPCARVSQEMTDIVRAIYDMMGKYTYPVLKNDAPKQHVDAFFQVTRLRPSFRL